MYNQPVADSGLVPLEHAHAARVLEKLINNRLFPHGGPGHPQFLAGKVTIGVGLDGGYPENTKEELQITLTDPHVEIMPSAVKDALIKALAEIPALKDRILFEAPEEHVVAVRKKLEEFIAKGAQIDPCNLQWKGFNSEVASKWNTIPDFALDDIERGAFGASFMLSVPETVGAAGAKQTPRELAAENIRARVPEIKNMLKARVLKYVPNLSPADKQALEAKMDRLEIAVTPQSGYGGTERLHVTVRSPEQEAANKANTGGGTPADPRSLEASNPLGLLSMTKENQQLQKALGRAFLCAGETAKEIFPLIAGREDMRRAICKALVAFKSAKPELARDVDALLADDLFKPHSWENDRNRQELRERPFITKQADKPGEMKIRLQLPANQAHEAIKAIAALDPALASPAQRFASVDHVELVGVTPPNPAMAATVHAMISDINQLRTPQAAKQTGNFAAGVSLAQVQKTVDDAISTVDRLASSMEQALPPAIPSPWVADAAIKPNCMCSQRAAR